MFLLISSCMFCNRCSTPSWPPALKANKNILISAHGNSLRTLCKYLFKISDQKINELEIPTGNPLIIEFDNNLEIKKYYYMDEARAKTIIFNQ